LEIACRAGAKRLAIVHRPPANAASPLAAAKRIFPATFLPREGETLYVAS